MSAYTFATDVPVRFRDIDMAGWVHNAVYLVYVEEARLRYFEEALGTSLYETPGAIAHQEIDYAVPIRLDDEVTVRYRVSGIGRSSIAMTFEIHADGELVAEGEVVHVVLDDDGDTRPVPEEWRERIEAFEDAPVEIRE